MSKLIAMAAGLWGPRYIVSVKRDDHDHEAVSFSRMQGEAMRFPDEDRFERAIAEQGWVAVRVEETP